MIGQSEYEGSVSFMFEEEGRNKKLKLKFCEVEIFAGLTLTTLGSHRAEMTNGGNGLHLLLLATRSALIELFVSGNG